MRTSLSTSTLSFLSCVACLASSSPILQVAVDNTNGAYEIRVGGKPWLHSGALRLFVNGEWHAIRTTEPPPPSKVCTPGKPNTDVASFEGIFDHFPNASDASCCAACQEHVLACSAWVRITTTEETFPENTCLLVEGARGVKPSSTRTAQMVDQSAPSVPQVTGMLRMASPPSTPVSGSDRFGSFSKTSVKWLANNSKGETASFQTNFRTYVDGRTVVLEQGVPSGAKKTNHKNVTFADGVHGQKATLEPYPFLHFPVTEKLKLIMHLTYTPFIDLGDLCPSYNIRTVCRLIVVNLFCMILNWWQSFNVSHPDSIFAKSGMKNARSPWEHVPHSLSPVRSYFLSLINVTFFLLCG
jgi:hypothetical protein